MKTIIISSDHNGVEDKQQLKTYLKGEGYRVIDIGPYTPEVSVDYVDYAAQLSTIVGNKGSRQRYSYMWNWSWDEYCCESFLWSSCCSCT